MITVLGSTGFIGNYIVNYLKQENIEFFAPPRDYIFTKEKKLGHVIYCIGLTADFREKPYETIEAHVCKLLELLKNGDFESLTYLSSTRLYLKSRSVDSRLNEGDDIVLNANDSFDIFGASKIAGELLLLNSGKPNVKIVRLSNVFGNDFHSNNFITSIVKDAIVSGKVKLQTTPDSSKDYIAIDDVCKAIIKLSYYRTSGIYNLTFGSNTTNEAITNEIARLTGAEIIYSNTAKKIIFQEINNSKLSNELGFRPSKSLIEGLPEIINSFSANL